MKRTFTLELTFQQQKFLHEVLSEVARQAADVEDKQTYEKVDDILTQLETHNG